MLRQNSPNSLVGLPRRIAERFWHLLSQTLTRWSRNDGNLLAASMAYYAGFSFFPLLMVLISALGFALQVSENAQDAQKQLLDLLSERTAPALAEEVSTILSQVQTRAVYSGPLALVTLLFGAIGMFSQMDAAFERLWQDTTPHEHGVWAAVKNALWNRLKAFLTLLALGALLLVAFVADLVLAALRTWAEDVDGGILAWRFAQLGFTVVLNAIVLTLVYKLMPRAAVRWLHAAAGGLLVAIVWQLGS